ncbi:DUF4148 domain-containing protein [Ottowia sp.]|jgi:Domain of unknown function (DUF4148)|uniref:DUF4148 domain-containing protein n=1 Tax=Ottowia sp. TaxID=1898956 RepID=UPI002C162C3D|nr:DUF4148 domain-containing protein [Ottowia sp.]HNR82655.1 DUF4148 domain-containing protein [Ottowia sp.]
MNFRKHAALPLVALAMTLPVLAQANSLYHSAQGEVGFTEHPDHWKSTKTRAQVMAEVEAARKDGTLALMQRGAPLPIKNTGPAKTRQQVIDEMRSESPMQRQLRLEQYVGG